MDSSKSDGEQPLLINEEEAEKLRRGRVSLRKAAQLIGIAYPTIRRHREHRHLITFPIGGQTYVNLTEIKRFLTFGNATEADWNNHEGNQENG